MTRMSKKFMVHNCNSWCQLQDFYEMCLLFRVHQEPKDHLAKVAREVHQVFQVQEVKTAHKVPGEAA